MKNDLHKKQIMIPILQALISSWALQESVLVEISWKEYQVNIPIIKYLFRIFQDSKGFGMNSLFCFLGFICLFEYVRRHFARKKSDWWMEASALIFAVGTIVGKSYLELGNWNYIFAGGCQFALALLVGIGYFVLYVNCIKLLVVIYEQNGLKDKSFWKKAEDYLFTKHPFLGPLSLIAATHLLTLLIFFPGTLQWDGLEQIATYMGMVSPWTKHHPIFSTWLMGKSVQIGQKLFHRESVGLFIFVFPQTVIQCLTFAYGCYLMGKMKTSTILRWFALGYAAFYPAWQIWAVTVVKDTYYYIFIYLFVLASVDIYLGEQFGKREWWKGLLLIISGGMIALTRSNGIYVCLLSLLFFLIFVRKRILPYLICLVTVCAVFVGVNNLYANNKGIIEGETAEALSIPIQQTARYLRDHITELTTEEREVLENVFEVPLEEVIHLYYPEVSDPVKAEFLEHPSKEELSAYFNVWFQQLWKHPDTYIQAYLHHTYGYFYPEKEQFWEGLGIYDIGNGNEFDFSGMHFAFLIKWDGLRSLYRKTADLFYQIPVLGMLYSPGMTTFLLVIFSFCLLAKGKWKEMFVLVPSLLTLLVCLLSPVNAYIRYMLPIMVLLPFNIAWVIKTCEKNE